MTSKRNRPNLSLGIVENRSFSSTTIIQLESPLDVHVDDDDDEDDDEDDSASSSIPLSSPSSASSGSPVSSIPNLESDSDAASDDLQKDYAVLEQLRKSVYKNLSLRPILRPLTQHPSPRFISKLQTDPSIDIPGAWNDLAADAVPSPASASSSIYYTPISEFRSPRTEHFSSPPLSTIPDPPHSIDPSTLFDRLSAANRPLLIDTRPSNSFLSLHIQHSINIAIPSLILKRTRKPGGGGAFQSLDALRQFITTEQGKQSWDLIKADGPWDGDIVLYDDDMDEKNKDNLQVTAWALLHALPPLLSYGTVYYLKGGISAPRCDHHMRKFIIQGETDPSRHGSDEHLSQPAKGAGLFQLKTQPVSRFSVLPEIERPGHSPLPLMPAAMHSGNIIDSTPSPPPSQVGFRRPPPPRRPSIPSLNRLDTRSAERLNPNLPKLQVRPVPFRSATLSVPPSASLVFQPNSPTHLQVAPSPPPSAKWSPSYEIQSTHALPPPSPSYFSSGPSTPRTPRTPMPLPPSPQTARPPSTETEDAFPEFSVSMILPGFLYLGPELTTPAHVVALQTLGVRRILNIAVECDDDQGLHLRETFDRYVRIPIRDNVEEDNIMRGVKQVCEILDDARLHSAPTYVHCKAGKSRSVTAVMAYLIHANHWTLARAYAFVLERRRGISPNIGFVSELMTFEEQELGGKSHGVEQEDVPVGSEGGGRRVGRESLPPFVTQVGEGIIPGPMSAGGANVRVGDAGQELEVKDASGRYRHARRAPVDETTLQPLRRVSKAGLESSAYA